MAINQQDSHHLSSYLPIVILMEPQMGENIGAAARSMKNFGLSTLRIVNPRDGWPNSKAIEMAKNAVDVIENAEIYPSLAAACHDIHTIYATTARQRAMIKPEHSASETAQLITDNQNTKKQSALLFGPERSGLDNNSITLASAICTIPVSDIYPSLNLAQAVTITCYEWFKLAQQRPITSTQKAEPLATKASVDHLLSYIEAQLQQKGYFDIEEKKAAMVRNLRNIFTRNLLTKQEVQTLQGVIRYLANDYKSPK